MRIPTFGSRLTFVRDAGHNRHGKPLGLFKCQCGNTKVLIKTEVKNEYVKSCGCMSREVTAAVSRARPYRKKSPVERFWVKVDKNGPIAKAGLTPCWLWVGAKTGRSQGDYTQGYFMLRSLRGSMTPQGSRRSRFISASRMAWILTHGKIKKSQLVLHKCDVGYCCNPDHLFLGTTQDNVKDKIRKGRAAPGHITRHIGSDHGRAKITETDVMEIRGYLHIGAAAPALARKYGVSKGTIQDIAHDRSWKHVRGARHFLANQAKGLQAIRSHRRRKYRCSCGITVRGNGGKGSHGHMHKRRGDRYEWL